MKKVMFGALALTALVASTAPAMAKHHHGKHHATKSEMAKKKSEGSAETADLNAKSLQQAQTPVPSTVPAVPAGTTVPAAPASTMPANTPSPNL